MSSFLPPLPPADRLLLRLTATLVPHASRHDWRRCWQAELWHRRHPRPGPVQSAVDLYPGVLCDAAWLRAQQCHRVLQGTAPLCILLLALGFLVSLLPLGSSLGSLHALAAFASLVALRFACEASLVTLVGFAISARAIEYKAAPPQRRKLLSDLFQVIKLMLLLSTAFALSEDLTQPFHTVYPFTAETLQPQLFVLFALIALRWSFEDQQHRCKHCLRSLSPPSRVGHPSRNFLHSNGTELVCAHGHGLLSIPELETSWRSASHWIAA